MRIALAIAITVWTLAAWGGRIGLLTSDEGGLGTWIRIGGSIVIGLFAAATLVIPQLEAARKPALVVFSIFTVVLWTRSMIVNWTGSGSLPFKLVHTVLAIGFFALAWWAFNTATGSGAANGSITSGDATSSRGDAVAAPDEAHRQQQGEGEATGLPES
jgi:hypothetical protein